jgi:acetyl-CoA synthetase
VSLDVVDGELVADPGHRADLLRPLPRRRRRAPAGPWHTGDRVRRDDDGYLYFEGRLDDVIISGRLPHRPVRGRVALVAHSAVAEAAVVAAPDEERGSVVRAVVVLRDGYAPPRRWPPSSRTTSRARRRRTSTRASSTSPTSCPRRRVER